MKNKELFINLIIVLSGALFFAGWALASLYLIELEEDSAYEATLSFIACVSGFSIFYGAAFAKTNLLRKIASEARKSAAFYKRVIDDLPIAVFGKDVQNDFRWLFVNKKIMKIAGLTPEYHVGKTDHELFPKEQADFFHNIDLKVVSSKDEVLVSVEPVTSPKERGTWLAKVIKAPIFDDDNRPIAVVGVLEDITEQKKNEEKLREFEEIIRSMNDAVIISIPEQEDRSGKIVFVNEAFTRITGYSAEDVMGKSPRVLLGESDNQSSIVVDRIRSALRANQIFVGEIPNKRKDGSECWVSLSTFPIKEENGHVKHFVFIERDITQNKLREEELRRARIMKERQQELLLQKEKAEAANQAKSEFLANMSHELRTPLNSILGMTRLLTETELTNEQDDIAKVVLHSSAHLLDIVNDILDLSKIEAQEVRLEKIGFDLESVLNDVATTLQPLASNKKLLLIKEYAETKHPYVLGDPTRLSRVLTNLMGNAIKYTDEGCVQIQTVLDYPEPGKVNFTCKITDTGIGIPSDKLNSVFDKFVQADTSTTRRYGGTGLGLAITRQLVELMGGKIGVTSRLGQGSTFWFTIPFEVTDEINKQLDPHRKRQVAGNVPVAQAKVLIAEDHPMNQLLMKKLMSSFGITNYKIADNGQKALDAYKAEKWDVILMDVHMPELNGFEATTAIRALGKISGIRVPIVALTANAMSGDREKCLRYDMDDYISKPVNIDEMKEVLCQWINFDHTDGGGSEEAPKEPEAATNNLPADESLTTAPVEASEPAGNMTADNPIDFEELLSEKPVNLEHLHSFTGGDHDADKELIDVFVEQSDINMETLEGNCVNGESAVWSEAAHMLKGGAGAVGANQLASLCAAAQKQFIATKEDRRALLEDIKKEYQTVKEYLKKIDLL